MIALPTFFKEGKIKVTKKLLKAQESAESDKKPWLNYGSYR